MNLGSKRKKVATSKRRITWALSLIRQGFLWQKIFFWRRWSRVDIGCGTGGSVVWNFSQLQFFTKNDTIYGARLKPPIFVKYTIIHVLMYLLKFQIVFFMINSLWKYLHCFYAILPISRLCKIIFLTAEPNGKKVFDK